MGDGDGRVVVVVVVLPLAVFIIEAREAKRKKGLMYADRLDQNIFTRGRICKEDLEKGPGCTLEIFQAKTALEQIMEEGKRALCSGL